MSTCVICDGTGAIWYDTCTCGAGGEFPHERYCGAEPCPNGCPFVPPSFLLPEETPDMTETPAPSAEEITLNTLRQWAERAVNTPAGNDHGRGYTHAARNVLAILDMNGRPPHESVVFQMERET